MSSKDSEQNMDVFGTGNGSCPPPLPPRAEHPHYALPSHSPLNGHDYASISESDSGDAFHTDFQKSRSTRRSREFPPTSQTHSSNEYDMAKELETSVRRARDDFDLLPPDEQPEQWKHLMTTVFPRFIPQRPDQLVLFLKVQDEWVHNEALARLFQLCLSSESKLQVAHLHSAEVEIWSMLQQNDSLPNRCHVIALLTLIWTRLWMTQGELGGKRHNRKWQQISAYQDPLDNNEDEALKDFLLFLDVNSSSIEWGLSWTLRKLYLMLCELARSKQQQKATDAVQLIRDHRQRTGPGFFLLHLVLVNAVNSLLLTTENTGHSTIQGSPDWDATYAEPLLQYLQNSLRKEDIRVHHDQRQVLLDVLRSHVFHRNLTIRKCLTQLLQDPYQKTRLPDSVEVDKVAKEMAAFRLKIDKVCRVPGADKGCQWREMRGKADGDGGRMEVQVHFYSHTLDCLKRQSSGRCSEVGPLLRAFDIRLPLEAKPFLTAVLQHEEHDLARLHVQASHASHQRLIHRVLKQGQYPVVEAKECFVRWTIQVVQALEYLHGKGIVLVDLSLHSLVLHESTVKVVNFDSALRWKTDKDTSVETMPMRWLAPESLLEGRFSPASDMLAVGRLLYQIWTGGLEPYGELYTADTDIVLDALADCAPLYRWNCIPTQIYNIIKSCNAPEAKRLPRLSVLKDDLQRCQAALLRSQELCETEWPELDVHQIARNHVPEKAKASQIERIQQRSRQTDYQNIEPFQRHEKAPAPKWESLTIMKEATGTVVYEGMTVEFVDKWWPRLRDVHMPELGRLSDCPQPEVFQQYSKGRQKRLYRDSRTLKEEAKAVRKEASPSVREQRMLPLLLQLAQALERLHAEGWVYRDLSPDTVLVTIRDKKILFHRLGRMQMYRRHEDDMTNKYTSFQEVSEQERFPPETVQAREYGPYSEVYVFAVTAWEVLETLKPRRNANADGERVKPDLCDARVFQVLQTCWRKKAHRPTMTHVATELGKIFHDMGLKVIPRVVLPVPHLPLYSSSDQSSSSGYCDVMEVSSGLGRDLYSSGESGSDAVETSSSWSLGFSTSGDDHDHSEDVANRSKPRTDRYLVVPDVSPAPPHTKTRGRSSSPRRSAHRSRERAQAALNDNHDHSEDVQIRSRPAPPNTGDRRRRSPSPKQRPRRSRERAQAIESDEDSAAESDRFQKLHIQCRRSPTAIPRHVKENPVYQSSSDDTTDGRARPQHRSPRGGS